MAACGSHTAAAPWPRARRARGQWCRHAVRPAATSASGRFVSVHLTCFPMSCVSPATGTELRQLDSVRIVLPVLRRRVRTRPAGRARERQDRSVVFSHRLQHLRKEVHVRILTSETSHDSYSRILVTTPAPTVLPPSRMAKRRPSSRAIGVMSVTVSEALAPGMTISVPAASSADPVTSVVRM